MKRIIPFIVIYLLLFAVIIYAMFDAGDAPTTAFQVGVLTWIFYQTVNNMQKLARIDEKLKSIEEKVKK